MIVLINFIISHNKNTPEACSGALQPGVCLLGGLNLSPQFEADIKRYNIHLNKIIILFLISIFTPINSKQVH